MNQTPEMNDRLKAAVRSVEAPDYLATRISAHLRAEPQRSAWRWSFAWMGAGAFAALTLTAALAYQAGYLRFSNGSKEAYIASVSNRVPTLMRVGLGDHVHCAVFRKFPTDAPKVADLAQRLPASQRPLIDVVQKYVPADYKLMLAHQCRYRGRKFVHLALKTDSHLLSLVIARKSDGESFAIEGVLPELVSAGGPVYYANVQRFELAAFESDDYLVYLISDLPHQQNSQMMASMSSELQELLRKFEMS
jgi:hypothetical protein